MHRTLTLIVIASLSILTGCASLRGGPPSCDGSTRRPAGSLPGRVRPRMAVGNASGPISGKASADPPASHRGIRQLLSWIAAPAKNNSPLRAARKATRVTRASAQSGRRQLIAAQTITQSAVSAKIARRSARTSISTT